MKDLRFVSPSPLFFLLMLWWGVSAVQGGFVNGVETFEGTVVDTGTWQRYLGYTGASITQNNVLIMDGATLPAGNVDCTTTAVTVGVGGKVSVEVTIMGTLGPYPTAGLSLTNNSGGASTRLIEDSQRYDVYWHGNSGVVYTYGSVGVPLNAIVSVPLAVGTKLTLEIERTSETSAIFRVYDAGMNALGSQNLSNLPAFVSDPYIGVYSNAALTNWDNVVVSAIGPPGDCVEVIQRGYGLASDLNEDCRVDAGDVGVLAGEWQKCNDPTNVDCVATVPPATGWVVEAGWDMPDAQWVHDHILAMEQKPFHGLVLDLGRRYPATTDTFAWLGWKNAAFSADLQQRIAQDVAWLVDTPFRRFREKSFLFVICAGHRPNPDWFDEDFSLVIERMEEIAGYVDQIGLAGLCIDPELYQDHIWNYVEQANYPAKSFAEYEQQVRLRGQQIAAAFRAGCPERPITLFFFMANSAPANQVGSNRGLLSVAYYGLLPAFVDGLLDVADENMTLIDGVESAYGAHDASYFDYAVGLYQYGVNLSSNPTRYAQKVAMGLGTMLDYDRFTYGWHTNPGELNLNYHSPSEYQWAISESIRRAELTWVWSETPNWWTGSQMPQAYLDAMVNATGLPGSLSTCEGVLAVDDPITGDLNQDCYVNLADVVKVAGDWLRCTVPGEAGCDEPW